MQLRNARLCLDCEEMHEEQQCPICASESFVYLTRWVPAEERRRGTRARKPETQHQPRNKTWIAGGLAGMALIAAGRWFYQNGRTETKPSDDRREPAEE